MVDNDSFTRITTMMGVVRDESFDEVSFHNSMYSFLRSSQLLEVDDNEVGESIDGTEFGGDRVENRIWLES